MYIIQYGTRIEINELEHHVKIINGKKMVLCHDDLCNEPLISGYCPICNLVPSLQSRQFWPIEEASVLDIMLDIDNRDE